MKRHYSTWRTWVLYPFRLVFLVFGCAAAPGLSALAQTWSTTDLKSGNPLPSGTYSSGSTAVQWQVGNYLSDGLPIYGILCIPPTSLPGPHPVAILNHGTCVSPTCAVGNPPTYPGIGAGGIQGCELMAESGWLTVISTYRGEFIGANILPPPSNANPSYTSGGQIELCKGEVNDVLNLLSAVTAMPNANAHQVFMWGHSHGSCITERAIERGAAVQVAVSIDGPTDFKTWSNSPPLSNSERVLRSSALNNPAVLANLKFLRIQAEGDTIVTPDQACELASKLSGSVNYYLDSNVIPPGVYYGSPSECAVFSINWVNQWALRPHPPGKKAQLLPDEKPGQPYPAPGPWPQTLLLMYGLVDDPNTGQHYPPNPDYHPWIVQKAWPEYSSFVNSVAASGGWSASIPAAYVTFE